MNYKSILRDFFSLAQSRSVYIYMIPGLVVTFVYLLLGLLFGWFDADSSNVQVFGFWDKIWYSIVSGTKWFSRMLYELTVITLFSPVMAMLSEKCDSLLTNRKFDFTIQRFIYELLRTLGIVATAFIFSALVFLLWKMFTWILPFLSFADMYVVFVLKAFFIGFSFFDYSLERYHVSIVKSWNYGVKNPILMMLLGAFFSLVFAIPVFGAMLAPFYTTLLSNAIWKGQQNA